MGPERNRRGPARQPGAAAPDARVRVIASTAMTAGDAGRRWTLDGARAVLGDVRARTERAVREAEVLLREREDADPSRSGAIDAGIQAIVSRWAREIEALGAEAKGAWLVDFDTGSGCYCWRWPEPELTWFHSHDEGFAGRTRIH